MADPLPWPSVLMPSSEDWSLRGGTRSGGQTFQGNEQIVASPTARWRATLSIPCWEPEHVRALRRVVAMGRPQTWLVGPYEVERAPWNVDFIGGKITYAQGEKDGPAWEAGTDTSSILNFQLYGAAALNDPGLSILRVKGGVLEPGMLFSLGGRLHIISALDGETGTPGGQGAANALLGVYIRPWARAAYPVATPVEFGRPVCTMRLASDDTGALELQLSRYGTVTVELVEAF